MRIFPRTLGSSALATLCAGAVLSGILAIPTAQADDTSDLRDKQKSVQGQIQSTGDALDASAAEVSATGAALLEAEAQLAGARTHLASVQDQLEEAVGVETQLQAKLTETETDLRTARVRLTAGRAEVAAQRQSVADTVTSIYTRGDPQLLAFTSLLHAQTPADVTRQMNFNDVVVGREDNAYADLRTAEATLQSQEQQVTEARAAVRTQHQQAADHVAEVEALKAQAADAADDVTSLVSTRSQARQVAVAAQSADEAQLAELHTQEAGIRKQILKAKKEAQARAAAAAAAAAAAKAAGDAAAAAAASAQAGQSGPTGGLLLAPVVGPVTSPFGYRIHPIYGYWGLHDGTDFGVACGEGLRAAGDGTVLSTYYSSVYGNRLYLDLGLINGKSITVVYNHMSGYAKSKGDVVERGDIVGYVGSTGWSTGCHLHFTVLEDGVAVDPMTYL